MNLLKILSINLMINFVFLLLFSLSSNPLLMALLLLMMSFSLFISAGLMINSWFGLSIMLIFSGGMMIIFLYMTSLCSNFKFNISFQAWALLFIFLLLQSLKMNTLNSEMSQTFSIFYLYNFLNWQMFIFLIVYILFSLMFVVSLSQPTQGSLKKFY